MATSGSEGRDWIYQRIARTTAPLIVDVGAGEGTYSILGRHLRLDAQWVAVEIYEPYIDRYHLEQKYDEVMIRDIRNLPAPPMPYVMLFGDIIEHMEYEQAVETLTRFMQTASEIMVSIPIVESIQGEVDGNCHEAHLYQWDFEEMKSLLSGCEAWRGDMIGRFWWRA